ncbi:histidine kinase [Colwellia sp. PAMC 21821]|uniref:histidine kinase n=1 Tax=Colwellia sp. PAMC 21821 TaxID=1816219 RepID=UPI0009BCC7B6|nr:histidine kinase [Colwellia sp. PAMC 21821]ARD42900.1 histidine kinase [Colwellia sp. PAMC 21821]
MKNIELPVFEKFIHNVRNPLNSIVLHAELGKMLIDNDADVEQIKNAFTVILQQCKGCEQLLMDMRKNNANDT